MSSWANIRIPRKRDLSQIPADLRPQIIPRAYRTEVLSSELYQAKQQQSTVEKNQKDNHHDQILTNYNPRQYITKKIDVATNPSAFELHYKEKSYVFVILRHIRTVRDNDLWISSYNSIRKFYTNKIVIIDDNSEVNTVNGKLVNTEVIYSEFPGAGEILPYYYFLKNKWADRMIFLHDSMFINRPFRDSELEGEIAFHWHFKSNGFDDNRKINTYISLLKNNNEVEAFISDVNKLWFGCFGATTICNLDLIQNLEEKYTLFSSLVYSIRTRKDRETFERVFGIIVCYEDKINKTKPSNFGEITSYPGAFELENSNSETATHILRQKGYDTAIIKVWRGR